jgi:K+-transporting ATPase ATPase C chain
MSSPRSSLRFYWVAVRAMLVFTAVLGVVYPLTITAIGQLALPTQSNGSLVSSGGKTVGSSLIGQSFGDASGSALPEWFQSRPSVAGTGYDASASSGSNLGPENPALIKAIGERQSAIEASDGVGADQIPADAVTASGSGLDPHISPEYALLQVHRISTARGLSDAAVRTLVEATIQDRNLGYLGEQTVNVLELNIALSRL